MNTYKVQYLHHLLLATTAALYCASILFNYNNILPFILLIATGTLIIYRISIWRPEINYPPFYIRLKVSPNQIEIGLFLLVIFYSVYNLPTKQILLFLILGSISILYFLTIKLKFYKLRGIRSIPIIKNVFLALMWTIVTLHLPLFCFKNIFPSLMDSLIRFLFILPICIAIDLRDLKTDNLAKIETIPTLIGFNITKSLAIILSILDLALLIINHFLIHNSIRNYIVEASTIVILIFILSSLKESYSGKMFTLLLDGCMMIQSLILLIQNYL